MIALMLVMLVTQLAGFVYTSRQQQAVIELRNQTREMRIVQQALVDKKSAVEDYLLTDDLDHLQEFHLASRVLEAEDTDTLRRLDAFRVRRDTPSASQTLQLLDAAWIKGIELSRDGRAAEAHNLLVSDGMHGMVERVRGEINDYLAARNAHGERLEANISTGRTVVLALQIVSGGLTVLCLFVAFRLGRSEANGRREAMTQALEAHGRVKILFEMADILQSATGYEDANAVLRSSASRLLPDLHGCLYVFNNSRDRLDLLTEWNGERADQQSIAPGACWALKRGKPHVNTDAPFSLTCAHHSGDQQVLEVPMMARGELYGLLTFSSLNTNSVPDQKANGGIISALADAMSLALSNIALREKLRNQALRDPLTGLYNRRYMEDMLDRFVLLSARTGTPVGLVMIDLDHFKRLNDEHGHLLGDTVLRAVAQTIKEGLRETDIACRYGGEELIVLLPDCTLEDAAAKAETLRARVEALSDIHGVRITASFGVAASPETDSSVRDLIASADAALYEAKHAGRNRVVATAARVRDTLAIAAE
ncbi:GGDEF domain-containing protein [Allosphingosinicella deserti]|uniref:GGDEF domain-containing protein n=1 Tax=Allosphingosinicella deserti TaxID=2116704 RepID=UPI001E347864|nr:GGDEF domain-containing protein [Sphingomonas deserti]